MKISKLNIESYRHLENLNFDFTYQTGERKGQPLDKICFIGQSATGKTGLLELVYEETRRLQKASRYEDITESENLKKDDTNTLLTGVIEFSSGFINRTLKIADSKTDTVFYKFLKKELSDIRDEHLIPLKETETINYFKANLISEKNLEIFTKNPIDLLEKYRDEILNIKNNFFDDNILFNDNVKPEIWLFLLNEILEYRKNSTQKISELINNLDLDKFALEYSKWQKENPNKLDDFAKMFNPLLEKLNLEVDLVNTEYSIPIKNKITDKIIPIQNTSTGTKGLLLSFLPLFKLDTKDSIILIDEPERSLYPDMQMDLMEHYQRLAPDAQFIVATHSPFIAASFEPEERFILEFDEEGKVAVRRGTSPIGDDPNDMLKNDFGLEFLMNKEGLKAFERFKTLKKRLASEKDEEEKDKLLSEILVLAKAYKF